MGKVEKKKKQCSWALVEVGVTLVKSWPWLTYPQTGIQEGYTVNIYEATATSQEFRVKTGQLTPQGIPGWEGCLDSKT